MTRIRPHGLDPTPQTARVALIYKNFAANKGISHIGLGVAALNTSRTLRSLGYWADVWPAGTAADIETRLSLEQAAAHACGKQPVSHVVISAPWVSTPDLAGLLMRHPDVYFAVVSHSNVGFLMADPNGIHLLRDASDLALSHHNLSVAGNSEKFCRAWGQMYGRPPQWLPNLYDVSTVKQVGQRQPHHPGQPLRLGVFGATRPLKNMITAVGACLEIAGAGRQDVEIYTSTGREEGGGSVRGAIQQLVQNVPGVRVIDVGWRSWPQFRSVVARMHCLVSPSYTESFCVVVADGVAEGVASAVSEAVDWAPADWIANSDDVGDVARVIRRLVADPHAVNEGQHALKNYVTLGAREWRRYLGGET